MKIAVITHKVDIDGHGGAILTSLAFGKENVDYFLAMPIDINKKLESVICMDKEKNYDLILVTDICPKEPLLSKIDQDLYLKKKIIVLDHHIGVRKSFKKEYDFVTLKWEENGVKVCGTSMLYEYLVKNNYLEASKKLYEFVELTRRYDTWQWKESKDDLQPFYLTTLMEKLGYDLYIEYMIEKLSKEDDEFVFTDFENKLVTFQIKDVEKYVKEALETFNVIKVQEYMVGVCFAENYRNEIKEYILENLDVDIDILAIVKLKDKNISYRSMKDNVDVNEFAKRYGGGGIPKAAGSQFTNEDLIEISKKIFE